MGRHGMDNRHTGRRRGRVVPRSLIGCALAVAMAGTSAGLLVPSMTASASAGAQVGLFVNSQTQSATKADATSLGVAGNLQVVTTFENGTGGYPSQADGSLRLSVAVGNMTPAQSTAMAQTLVARGHADAYVRVMWEQNQNVNGWFTAWNEGSFSASAWIAEYQSIVTAMRAVAGQHFVFVWNPDSGNWSGNQNAGRSNTDTWPGSSYVDVVGIDAYDNASIQANVGRWITYAQTQGKPIAFPEWGLHGTDDPAFIDWMARTVAANDTAYQAYFDYCGSICSQLSHFPNSKAAYARDFGGTLPPSTTTTTAPPSSTTTTTGPPSTTTTTSPPSTTTTTAPPSSVMLAADNFARTVTTGWGSADVGGAWTLEKGTSASLSVNGSSGAFALRNAVYTTAEHVVALPATSAVDFAATFDVGFNDNVKALKPLYGGVVAGIVARYQNANDTGKGYYRLQLVWNANSGKPQLFLRMQDDSGQAPPGHFKIEQNLGVDPTADYPNGGPYAYHVKVQVTGANPTSVAMKAWKVGASEPSGWQLSGTDTGNSGPQAAGPIAVRASADLQSAAGVYLPVTSHVTVANLVVHTLSATPPPPTTTTTTKPPTTTTTTKPPTTTTTTTPLPSKTAPPAAPTGLTAKVSGTSVSLSWTNPAGALGDDVFRDGTQIAWPGWPNVAVAAYADVNVALGTHSYTVSAYNSAGVGPRSAPVSATVVPVAPTGAPAAPTGLTAKVSGTTVSLSWTNPAGALGDDVYRDGVKVAWPGWPGAAATTATDAGVAHGSHTYSVSAYNSSGEGPRSASVTVNV